MFFFVGVRFGSLCSSAIWFYIVTTQNKQYAFYRLAYENNWNLEFRHEGVANEAWGSYWNWDPKESWAFITWTVFAIYLHTRTNTKGLPGYSAIVAYQTYFVRCSSNFMHYSSSISCMYFSSGSMLW
ncbi:uncharacterized protein LOC131325833 [Rhododendron vialii]|uniref:uncharacterized protein LOC131325833 n=1 Tax=Rhododendron vialii TaxID=182163 RepID=UPI00265F3E2A|nr:uncharacterized protein LOC131325833 [Rhododendron vialii]